MPRHVRNGALAKYCREMLVRRFVRPGLGATNIFSTKIDRAHAETRERASFGRLLPALNEPNFSPIS